jgi:hypothetical protein
VIAELDRYHGVVLRQILVAHGQRVRIGVADLSGRVDVFCLEGAAFQVKHSSKRLSPWQFTYMPDNLAELDKLRRAFDPVWIFLVCGQDGVVGLSLEELTSIVQVGEGGVAWIRVSRSRNSMYRVGGTLGELPRAKPRGVHAFLAEVFGRSSEASLG